MMRLNKITRNGMTLYLVSSLVIPALHLAFAHHRHRRDPETGQFLDVLAVDDSDKDTLRPREFSSTATIASPSIGGLLSFQRCPIANGLLLNSTAADSESVEVSAFFERHYLPSISAACRPQSLILATAPKRSPPHTPA